MPNKKTARRQRKNMMRKESVRLMKYGNDYYEEKEVDEDKDTYKDKKKEAIKNVYAALDEARDKEQRLKNIKKKL